MNIYSIYNFALGVGVGSVNGWMKYTMLYQRYYYYTNYIKHEIIDVVITRRTHIYYFISMK